jgi:SurA N-terminal domain
LITVSKEVTVSRIRGRIPVGVIVGAVLGVLLGTSACGGSEVGAAAVVGGERITVSSVQDRAQAFLDTTPDPSGIDTGALQRRILQQDVRHVLLSGLAADENVTVSEADVDDFLDQLAAVQGGDLTQFKLDEGFTDDSLRAAVRDELMRSALAEDLGSDEAVEEAVAARAEEIGVTLNRRYGTWEGNQLVEGTGAISSVLDEAAA